MYRETITFRNIFIAIRGKNVITVSTDNIIDVHKLQPKTFTITKKNEKTSNLLSTFNRSRGPQNFEGIIHRIILIGKNFQNVGNVKNKIIKTTSKNLFLRIYVLRYQ